MGDGVNGASDDDIHGIPLHTCNLRIRIVTTRPPENYDEKLTEQIADAIWTLLPSAEDGDVFVTVEESDGS